MAQDNLIYPVGLFYVGPGNVSPNVQVRNATGSNENIGDNQSPILPINDDVNSKSTDIHVAIKEEQADSENNNVEDRNSESYWEKRKRFTLAFAAGLRKFIQLHPELLRYGPKKNQVRGNVTATVTSSGIVTEDSENLKNDATTSCGRCIACLKTEDCGKCAFCLDMSKFGGKDELKKLCIRRQCLHAPVNKNTAITITNTKSDSSSPSMSMTPEDSMEGPPSKSKHKVGGHNAETIKQEIADECEEEEEELTEDVRPKRSRNASPRTQRTRKPRRNKNDDDEDYIPSQRRRKTKQNQAVDSLLKGISIKIEPLDVSE